ncbi:MAG TPA: alpha-galactosidase [Nevskiaceae bacterium]|nr:alpha-galactosidase [Nevskiaceae bacterium]
MWQPTFRVLAASMLAGVLLAACNTSAGPQTADNGGSGGSTGTSTGASTGSTTGGATTGDTTGGTPPPDPYAVKFEVSADRIVAHNGLVERVWSRAPFLTQSLTDLRNHRAWSQASADFSIALATISFSSDALQVSGDPVVADLPNGGRRLTLTLGPTLAALFPPGFSITRTVELYPGVAGMRSSTQVTSTLPVAMSGYTLDQAVPGNNITATLHAFHAGSDWRDPEWTGPQLVIGDAQPGDWRTDVSGATASGTAQWMSLSDASDARLYYVMERNDYASSEMSYDGNTAAARVDLSRDVIYLGPLEEQLHVGNPGSGPGRERLLLPGTPLQLEPVYTGVALGADDEALQHYRYLAGYRMPPYPRAITFNSNGVDANAISTGAKDDLNFTAFQQQLPIAAQIGIETFVFDDGWQGRSGDWCPDSVSDDPACADPRRGTDAKFDPRFPDAEFKAVQALLISKQMKLGLWMSPLHFNPQAVAFKNHPEWACLPIDAALLAEQENGPYDGSNEAGILQWNAAGVSPDGSRFIDFLEGRIRTAIDDWGVRYFKFDFTAWLDCAGPGTTDLYGYRETFMAMLDRIHADHPDVTIQMDETNDYRLWPFEAIARGPTWYQNGSPSTAEALHANWVLAPYVPLYALGRNALNAGTLKDYSAGYQMAVALLSHVTFFNDLKSIPADAIPVVKQWTDWYKAHRADIAALAYPLTPDDPLAGDQWAAFQTLDPVTGNGVLLAYRQDAEADTQTVKLRNIADGNYRLHLAPDEATTQDYSAQQLRDGIALSIGAKRQAQVWRIEQLQGAAR